VPASRRTMGHYALPVLWGEQMVGWANLRVERGQLRHALGFVAGRPPRGAVFRRALDEERARFETSWAARPDGGLPCLDQRFSTCPRPC
jgi:uncharacterized protein